MGAAIFGVGWGLAGLCPGPAVVAAFAGNSAALVLFSARALMIAFGVMMVVTATAMLRRASQRPQTHVACETKLVSALVQGFVVGTVTGVLGVGGGFVIVPAMVLFGGLAMEYAVGTSLVVIAMNSLAGFVGHIGEAQIDGPTTLAVSGVAASVRGSVVGWPAGSIRRFCGGYLAS